MRFVRCTHVPTQPASRPGAHSPARRRGGPPRQKLPPVGDPPITRWEYPEYTVYFEYDKVITSVYKHKKK